jgi:hypothetical protein
MVTRHCVGLDRGQQGMVDGMDGSGSAGPGRWSGLVAGVGGSQARRSFAE